MYVKPAPGLKVRDNATKQHLPAEGADVPMNSYWARRLAAGDVIACQPPQAPKTKGSKE